MSHQHSYFPNKTAKQTFFILLFGCTMILLSFAFVLNALWHLPHLHFNHERQIHQINRLYRNIKNNAPIQLSGPIQHAIHFNIAQKPAKDAIKITDPTFNNIKHLPFTTKKISLKISDKKWLNIKSSFPKKFLVLPIIGFSLLIILLLMSLIILCIWAVKRLAIPVSVLSKAAKNVGRDVNSPLLARTQNPETNEVIDAFNQMQSHIRKLINDRTQMLAAISHDLRTPITRLKLRAEYLEGSMHYEKICADLDEMENMITSLLAFIREDVHNDNVEDFDLDALLDSICNDMSDAGFDVTYQSDEIRSPFHGYFNSLKRALVNLIDNATKYGQKVFVTLVIKNDKIYIEIDDNGPGIAPENLEKVFEPFYRVEPSRSRQTGGTGLGLSIAKDIIRAHRGDVVIMNRSQGGLRVTVTLPLK